MRCYIGIDPGTESMGFAIYFPENNTFEITHIKRQDILNKYFKGKSSSLNILMGIINECQVIYYSLLQQHTLRFGWIERTFSIKSPIFSPLLVVLTTAIKEELGLKVASVKHWRKVLTDKGNITKKDCVALLKKTYPVLEGLTNDEVEALGIAIACAIESGEPNPIRYVSNRAIRKINRKVKTKNGKKSKNSGSINGNLSQQSDVGANTASS